MMELHPEFFAFRIVHIKEKPSRKKRPISEFRIFETYQLPIEFLQIRLIVFYFNTTRYNYPYSIHPIILERKDERFNVIFYHFYNTNNILAGIHDEQKKYDYHSLCSFLQNSVLLSAINDPFYVSKDLT